jgi:hypothetical protein
MSEENVGLVWRAFETFNRGPGCTLVMLLETYLRQRPSPRVVDHRRSAGHLLGPRHRGPRTPSTSRLPQQEDPEGDTEAQFRVDVVRGLKQMHAHRAA